LQYSFYEICHWNKNKILQKNLYLEHLKDAKEEKQKQKMKKTLKRAQKFSKGTK
jgi:hypothetical protein